MRMNDYYLLFLFPFLLSFFFYFNKHGMGQDTFRIYTVIIIVTIIIL